LFETLLENKEFYTQYKDLLSPAIGKLKESQEKFKTLNLQISRIINFLTGIQNEQKISPPAQKPLVPLPDIEIIAQKPQPNLIDLPVFEQNNLPLPANPKPNAFTFINEKNIPQKAPTTGNLPIENMFANLNVKNTVQADPIKEKSSKSGFSFVNTNKSQVKTEEKKIESLVGLDLDFANTAVTNQKPVDLLSQIDFGAEIEKQKIQQNKPIFTPNLPYQPIRPIFTKENSSESKTEDKYFAFADDLLK